MGDIRTSRWIHLSVSIWVYVIESGNSVFFFIFYFKWNNLPIKVDLECFSNKRNVYDIDETLDEDEVF